METEPLLPQRTPEKERSTFWEGKDGALGWIVATAIMLINFITIGLGRMSGILYVDFMREYKVNRKLASAPFSVQQSTRNLFGPLVGVLGQRFGIRSVTIVGGLLGAGSAAACAFAKDITWITVFWGGFYGTGIAFTSTLSQVILDEYFENHLSSASGLSFSGGSVGAMVFSFVLQRTIDEFGLENAYFIMGAVILLVVPLAMTLTSPPWTKKHNVSNRKESLNSKTSLNKQLRKSLANEDMFSIEKEIDKNYDKSLNRSFLPAESFRSNFEISGRFDQKDDSNSDLKYGTFKKDDTTFGTQNNADQNRRPSAVPYCRQELNGNVSIEKENIAKLTHEFHPDSTQEFHPDSKARNIESSKDLAEDDTSVPNLNDAESKCNTISVSDGEVRTNDQDIVDHNVVNDSSNSNKKISRKGLSFYKVESEEEIAARCNGINNHSLLQSNDLNYSNVQNKSASEERAMASECKDKEVSELNRKLSPNFNYNLLYLRLTSLDDLPQLSFPIESRDTITNFCSIDSANTFNDKLNCIEQSTVNDDLKNLTNRDIKFSDYKVSESTYNADDNVIKNSMNLYHQENQSEISKNLETCAKHYPPGSANNSLSVDQDNVLHNDTTHMRQPSDEKHNSSVNSKDTATNENYQLESNTKHAFNWMNAVNSVSKNDRLLYLNQNPDFEFLRKNTNYVVKILMLNANFFSEQLFRKQLAILYSLVEKEKMRNSSEKYNFKNEAKKDEIDKSVIDHKGLDSDNTIVDDIFKAEHFNIFLDHLYCVLQKNESSLVLNFEEKHKVRKILAELKKLYQFAYIYKQKHKRKEPESSSSSAEEIISIENDAKHKTTKHKNKGSCRRKSKSLDRDSPLRRQSSWKQQSLPSKLPSSEQWRRSPYEERPTGGCCSIPRQIRTVLKLYLNPAFLVICLCRAVHLLTFMGVLTVIVDYSMDRGLKESDGKYAVTAMSLGDLIGRLCSGWVTDCMFVGLERFMLIAMLLIGVVSISFPLVPPSTILLLVCVYSILQGSVFIRHPILVSKYTRTEERTVGMGFMTLFSGLLGFFMPMYIGHFRDGIGSYDQVFYINGAICAGIGFLWIFEPWLKKFAA